MKKKTVFIMGTLVLLLLIYFFGSGFLKNTSAIIEDYSVSNDGKILTISVGVSSSAGYIRDVSVHQQWGGKLYLDCYSAFGGLNGSIGANDTFTFQLDENTNLIAICRNANCYEEVLVKEEDGCWRRAAQ